MLQDRLRQVIGRQELTALFQPIIHMQSGEIIGYEGLIRGAIGQSLALSTQSVQSGSSGKPER